MKLQVYIKSEFEINYLYYPECIGHVLDKVFLRRQLYPSLKFAYEDFVFGYKADEPQPLTENYEQFDKTELVNKRGSRYSHGIQQ